jgi:hypothetical protein
MLRAARDALVFWLAVILTGLVVWGFVSLLNLFTTFVFTH